MARGDLADVPPEVALEPLEPLGLQDALWLEDLSRELPNGPRGDLLLVPLLQELLEDDDALSSQLRLLGRAHVRAGHDGLAEDALVVSLRA